MEFPILPSFTSVELAGVNFYVHANAVMIA